jgi:phosphoglycolate phosphatase-like HAD superfamily hydrolase
MTLLMFDVDGTLTETFRVDEECYVQALKDVFNFSEINTDWSSYRHTSDSGILGELIQARFGRTIRESERAAFQTRFMALLTEAASVRVDCFHPVTGAKQLLQKLTDSPDFAVSLATGGWRVSALFKLRKAGLSLNKLPAAFADDATAREEIMSLSLKRATAHHQQTFESVIYIGDGVWDVRAANKMGFQFIGIGSDEKAGKLRLEGAEFVFLDYSDEDAFMSALKGLSQRPVLTN